MRLTDEEQAMRAGTFGPAVAVGDRASDQGRQLSRRGRLRAGGAGPHHGRHRVARRRRRRMAGALGPSCRPTQRRVRIPTITDPRGTDFASAHKLKHQPWMLDLERRAIAAFEALGVLMTDTCINYQTIMPPVRGEHCAYGDTGVVIYSNSVCGARSNFEGGPSALSAGLTGRTPRYGYHLDEHRLATLIVQVGYHAARIERMGRARRHRRPARRRLLAGAGADRARPRAHVGRDEAFRRGAGELRLGRAVPHDRHHAGGAAARRSRAGRRAAHP